jgi:hypothetical protein
MAAKENNVSAASPAIPTSKSSKSSSMDRKSTELKYFALVLVEEKIEFAYRLDTIALKKTAN